MSNNEETLKLRLTIDVHYSSNGTSISELKSNLENIALNAAREGALTGHSEAEVESYFATVIEVIN